MYLVRSGAISGFHGLVSQLGHNPITMIRRVGLTPGQFRDDNTYISYTKMAELLETAAHICECPDFGLLLACQQSNEVLGELPAIAAQSSTVGAALKSVDKVLYLHARGVHIKQMPGLRTTRISLQFDFSSSMGISQLIQMSVGHLAGFTAELMNADRNFFPLYFRQPMKLLPRVSNNYYRHLHFSEIFDGIVVDNLSLNSRN